MHSDYHNPLSKVFLAHGSFKTSNRNNVILTIYLQNYQITILKTHPLLNLCHNPYKHDSCDCITNNLWRHLEHVVSSNPI